MVNIQWHHSKISPKLSIFTPKFSKFSWGNCPQTPLESKATYFVPSKLIFCPVRTTTQVTNSGRGRAFSCGKCGRTHKPKECPAYGQQYSICHKFNHFAKVCRRKHLLPHAHQNPQLHTKKKIHVVDKLDVNSDSETTLSLDPIQIDGLAKQSWYSTISTSSGDVNFKLDTGAEEV